MNKKTSQRRGPLSRLAALGAATILSTTTVQAGFPGVGGTGAVSLGGGNSNGTGFNINAPVPPATITTLRDYTPPAGRGTNPFAGKTDEQIRDKIRALRCLLMRMVSNLRQQNPSIASCVDTALRNNRICIDTTRPFAAASIMHNNLPNCGNEPINIGILSVPCSKSRRNVAVFTLLSLMLHEGLHGVQDWRPMGVVPGEPPIVTAARRFQKYHQNEQAASQLQVDTACDIIAGLQAIVDRNGAITPGLAIPGTKFSKWFVTGFINETTSLSNADRKTAAQNLINAIRPRKVFWQQTADCRQEYVNAYTTFLAQVPMIGIAAARANLNATINAITWFARYGNVAGLGNFSLAYLANGSSMQFEQISPDQHTSFPLQGIDEFYGGLLLPDQDVVLFSGGDSASGEGVIFTYEDTNRDGFFEQDTHRELLRQPQLFGGFDLALNPATGEIVGLQLRTGDLFTLVDSDRDGLPDQPQPIGNLSGTRDDLQSIVVSQDGQTIFGVPEIVDDGSFTYTQWWEYEAAQFDEALGIYLPAGSFNVVQNTPVAPMFLESPLAGDQFLHLHGQPGQELEVFDITSGLPGNLLGQVTLDPLDGGGTLTLEMQLTPDLMLQAVEPVSGMRSAAQRVFPMPPAQMQISLVEDGGGRSVRVEWPAGSELQLSDDLRNWSNTGQSSSPQLIPLGPNESRLFFRFLEPMIAAQ